MLYITTAAAAAAAVAHTRTVPLSGFELESRKNGIHILVVVCKTYLEVIMFFFLY